MKITKREIIASITIFSIMMLLGFFIGSKISDEELDNNEKYNKALKIESTDLFQYGMDTNVGNAFVYGDLEAVDAVYYTEIDGKYLYVEKIKEEYTRHTRVVEHSDGKRTWTTTETYWTWDRVSSEKKHSTKIKFLSIEFDYEKINIPGEEYIDTVKESSTIRHVYYGVHEKNTGTIFTSLKDGTISNKSYFYNSMTIKETIKYLETRIGTIIFWIFWIVLTIGAVVGFYYLDNNWLNE